MTTAATRAFEPVLDGSAEGIASSDELPSRGFVRSMAQLLGSNALISLTGLACLPLLYRNLGAAAYGHFSLFMLALGLASSLDFARPTLVRELARGEPAQGSGRLMSLIGVSQCWLAPVALIGGSFIFGLPTGIALGLATLLFVAASGPYAILAAQNCVGLAASVRNLAWVGAFLLATTLSFLELPAWSFVWPFVLANLIVLSVNRRLAGANCGPWFPSPDLEVLRDFKAQSLDILGLSLATAVVISADKLILQGQASEEIFGRYSAQYDLAIKINVLSTALGTVLYPNFSRLHAQSGFGGAAKSFVRQASWIVASYFAVLMVCLAFSEQILELVLGEDSAQVVAVYPLLLVGIFLALFGHIITPWQRACGDFRTHRRVYAATAVVMVVLGLVLIPHFGIVGAALTYLSARLADVILIAFEVRRIPSAFLQPWRVVVLVFMILTLAIFGGYQFVVQGGLA